ncbi:MAG: hypothetical protein ACREP9_10430, partial [Candidatus Dormibacteraceae bacterium]
MPKNVLRTPHGGFTLSKFGAADGGTVGGRGRPEREIRTPVNMGNGPHRDNGEGVAATPLPYPLKGEGNFDYHQTPILHAPFPLCAKCAFCG